MMVYTHVKAQQPPALTQTRAPLTRALPAVVSTRTIPSTAGGATGAPALCRAGGEHRRGPVTTLRLPAAGRRAAGLLARTAIDLACL